MDVIMPQLGETVTEGTISAWLKEVGDSVDAGENLFEVETDKVSVEVPAIKSGVLTAIRVDVGDTVAVGTVVAVIDSAGTAPAVAGNGVPAAEARSAPAVKARSAPSALRPFEEVRTPTESFGSRKMADGLRITPLARRLIVQGGLDVAAIAETVRERGGTRVAAADVRAAAKEARGAVRPPAPTQAPAPLTQPSGRDVVVPFNRIRERTARHLEESWRSIPHVYQAVEVDFSRVDRARRAARQAVFDRSGVKLTFLPFVARAVCIALADFRHVNATLEGDRLVVRDAVNLGIAVDLDHAGLVVPVVRDAGQLTVVGLATAIARLTDKARAGQLAMTDLENGTYSISNNGSFGTLLTAPIINAPQVAVLSMDAVTKRPVVVETDDGSVIVPRPVAIIGQSFDHRAFDGAYSASFLKRVKSILETRDWQAELG
jgi:pyruvate dehydrogenase E2 component (dihydrolipoyllysine-residue acetyltransferase)